LLYFLKGEGLIVVFFQVFKSLEFFEGAWFFISFLSHYYLMNPLLKLYFAIEGAYYKFLDFLQKLGVPVYKFFVSPLEERGVPSFPVFVLIVLVVLSGLVFLFSPKASVATTGFVVEVLSNGAPVENASVRFLGAGGSFLGSGLTDNAGMVVFNGSGVLSVVVSKNGFQESHKVVSGSFTIISLNASQTGFPVNSNTSNTNTSNANFSVNLNESGGGFSFAVASNGGSPPVGSGVSVVFTLTVNLLCDNNSVDGVVSVYDNNTNALIAQSSTSDGSVVFDNSNSNLSVGEVVYFSVSGGWFLNNSPVLSLQSGANSVNLNVWNVSSGVSSGVLNSSFLRVLNSSDNSSVGGASVWILNLNGRVVLTGFTGSDGVFNFSVPSGGYYALITASGFVNGVVQVFQAPVSLNVYLSPAASCSLTVSVFDENGNPAYNGSVSVFEVVNGFSYLLSPFQTVNLGSAVFTGLPVNVSVVVKASVGDQVGSNSTFLSEGYNNVSVFVFSNFGFLNVTAFDFLSGVSLNFNASVEFTEGLLGNKTVSCSGGAGGCLLSVEADRNWVVSVSTPGYFTGSAFFNVGVGSVTNLSVPLVSLNAGESVVLTKVSRYGASDNVSKLLFNTPYTACFNVHGRSDSRASGFYVGGNGLNIFTFNNSLSGVGSVKGCTGSPVNFSLSNYSWVDLSSGGALNGLYCVGFTVPPAPNELLNLSLNYRVYSIIENNSGGLTYFYLPFSTSGGDECSLPVFNSFFTVQSPNDVIDNPLNPSAGIGSLIVNFSQTSKSFEASPSTCGDKGGVYNCNDFQGLSGYTNPLIVGFTINVNLLYDKNFYLLLKDFNSAEVLSVNLTSTTAIPSCTSNFGECDVKNGLSELSNGHGVITGFVVVNLTGGSPAGFTIGFSNGSESINRSFIFNVTSVSPLSFSSAGGCGVNSFVNITYNSSVYVSSGGESGWVDSCNNVPMRVSDVFPGDALKVYVGGDCNSLVLGWNNFIDGSGPSGVKNCFTASNSLQSDSNGSYIIVKFNPYNPGCPLKEVGNQPLVDSNGNVYSNVSASFVLGCGDYNFNRGGVSSCSGIGLSQGDCNVLNFNVSSYSTGEGLNFLPAMTSGYAYNAYVQVKYAHYNCHVETGIMSNDFPCDSPDCVACYTGLVGFGGLILGAAGYDPCLDVCTGGDKSLCPGTCSGVDPVPSYSFDLASYSLKPQLWVLVNNNQLDSNRIVTFNYNIAQSPLSVSFTGPSVAALGFNPSVLGGVSDNNIVLSSSGAGSHFLSDLNSLESLSNPAFSDFYLSLDSSNKSASSLGDALSVQNNGELNYRINTVGGSVSDYLSYVQSVLDSTALWRGNLDVGAPLKYFNNGQTASFSFVRVFKVDSNDSFFFDKDYSDAGDSCPPVAESVNSILTNNVLYKGKPLIPVSSSVFNSLRRIPRGFYVVDYTYTVNSNGSASGGYGWSVQSTPLVLNSSNYFENFSDNGCDKSQIPSSLPLCGYIFSTNNHENINGGSGLGDCILSSSAYPGNSFKNDNLTSYLLPNANSDAIARSISNQLSTDGAFYTSSLIPLNFSCTSPNCFKGSLRDYPVGYFMKFPSSPGSNSFNTAGCSLYNALTFGVFDDAGDVFISNPGSCGSGLAMTPITSSLQSGSTTQSSSTKWVFNNFDAFGLH